MILIAKRNRHQDPESRPLLPRPGRTRGRTGRSWCRRRPVVSGRRPVCRRPGEVQTCGCSSSTDGAPDRACRRAAARDHGNPRTSRRPGFGQRAPFEHRNVHSRRTNDLAVRICAGQGPVTGAPPGTRTPNPRIKSPNPTISSWFDWCRLVSFPQASDESLCRHVSARAGCLGGHRAPIEHRRTIRCSIDRPGGGVVEPSKQRISVRGSVPGGRYCLFGPSRGGRATRRRAGLFALWRDASRSYPDQVS